MESSGEKRIGTYLKLNSDTYAVAFLYQLHRYYLEDDCSDDEDIPKLYENLIKEN